MTTLPPNGHFPNRDSRDSSGTGEDTLRLLAGLPAPAGLDDRLKAGLRQSPQTGRILMWRGPLRPVGGWMHASAFRGAAAAAIVCAVAGGGWQMYSHLQMPPTAKVVATPSTGNGFSTAGGVRRPETLEGPVLKHPSQVNVVEKVPERGKTAPATKKPRKPSPPPVE